jgi:hypothetical protein
LPTLFFFAKPRKLAEVGRAFALASASILAPNRTAASIAVMQLADVASGGAVDVAA